MLLTKPHGLTNINSSFIKISNNKISEVVEFKYHGVLETSKLSWKSHLQQILIKIPSCFAIFYTVNQKTTKHLPA